MKAPERRKHSRIPVEGTADVDRGHVPAPQDTTTIYLRDMSVGGLSGTWFGDDPPGRDEPVTVHTREGHTFAGRVAWTAATLDTVYMVGVAFGL